MKPRESWPVSVFQRAHREYPNAVAARGLYCVAFFGHGRPANLNHRETCESIWRGLCRKALREAGAA